VALGPKPPPRTAASRHNPENIILEMKSCCIHDVSQESPSLLAVMVTVFDAAFGPEGAAGPTATPRNVLPVSGTSRGGVGERSIDSLADLAHLLVRKALTNACASRGFLGPSLFSSPLVVFPFPSFFAGVSS